MYRALNADVSAAVSQRTTPEVAATLLDFVQAAGLVPSNAVDGYDYGPLHRLAVPNVFLDDDLFLLYLSVVHNVGDTPAVEAGDTFICGDSVWTHMHHILHSPERFLDRLTGTSDGFRSIAVLQQAFANVKKSPAGLLALLFYESHHFYSAVVDFRRSEIRWYNSVRGIPTELAPRMSNVAVCLSVCGLEPDNNGSWHQYLVDITQQPIGSNDCLLYSLFSIEYDMLHSQRFPRSTFPLAQNHAHLFLDRRFHHDYMARRHALIDVLAEVPIQCIVLNIWYGSSYSAPFCIHSSSFRQTRPFAHRF